MKSGASLGSKSLGFGVAAVLLVVLVAAAALLLAPQAQQRRTVSSGPSSVTVQSSHGLALELSLNSTRIRSGQSVSVVIDERNTLGGLNNVSASYNWPMKGLALGPCASLNFPMGLLIVQGNYSATDVVGEQPLALYQPGTYMCPMILTDIGGYAFQPLSDNASVFAGCIPGPCFAEAMSSTLSFKGYWNGGTPGAFTDFTPGVYTVVGGDEWGTLAVLHLQVVPNG